MGDTEQPTTNQAKGGILHERREAVTQFQRGHSLWHFRAFDRCIPIFEDLILEHPHHPVSELGAALLLDALENRRRHVELRMWLDLVNHIDGFLDSKPQLRVIVRVYRRRFRRAIHNSNRGQSQSKNPTPMNENQSPRHPSSTNES